MTLLAGPLAQCVDDLPRIVGEHEKDRTPLQPRRKGRPRLQRSENLPVLQAAERHGRTESRSLLQTVDAGHLPLSVQKGEAPLTSIKDERHAVRADPDPLDPGVLSRPLPLSARARSDPTVAIEEDKLARPPVGHDQGRIRQEHRSGDPDDVEIGIRCGGIDQSRLDLGEVKHVHIGDPHDVHARGIDGGHRSRAGVSVRAERFW